MSTRELRIDEEFAALIPPLTDDEYSRLEQSIIAEGCRDPIITWNGIIVDGHHRFKICKMHNIDFQIAQKEFASRKEVFLWMIQNQLARRNLNDFQRIEIVRKYENAVKALAKLRQGTRNDLFSPNVNQGDNIQVKLPESETEQSRDKLGKLAGVSGSTYEHATKVIDHAPTTIVNAARNNQISINAAYEITKLPVPQQSEIAQRIEQGESAKSVISQVRSLNRKSQHDTTTANAADDVQLQSAASETSFRNEELNAQHEANTTAMNEERQLQEVSSAIHTETQTQQLETPKPFKLEATEHETLQQTQPTSEDSDSLTVHSDKRAVPQHNYAESNTYYQNELEIEPEEPAIVNIHITSKKYSIIYAEPSWTDNQSFEELLKLPVQRVADENCALFLWVNAPRLPEAQKVSEQWGFSRYETIPFVWCKITKNNEGITVSDYDETSKWTRENTEFCIVATKGTIQPFPNDIPQVTVNYNEQSNIKPDYFKEMIIQLLGELPAIELFPDTYRLEYVLNFHFNYNSHYAVWDMAASKKYLVQLAQEQRTEMNNT